MLVPIEFSAEDTVNILVLDELDYDRFEMGRELQRCLSSITYEQGKVYEDYDRFEMGRELQRCLSSITYEQGKVYDVVMDVVEKPFGGKVIVLGGYFRQILPVVLKASRQEFLRLVMGMLGNINDGKVSIQIPDDMLIGDSKDPFRHLLEFVYTTLLSNMYDPNYFQGRAILTPTNECVESVNDHLMSLLPGEEKVYMSSDSMGMDEQTTEDNAEIYSTKFLNTIR
ncbi:hypothetical protein ABFS83_08G204600 [Erythranthe nasuta]